MKTIFPASIIQHTTEYHQSKISIESKAIYLIVMFLVFSALISLPFINVDVAVQARGSFQSSLSRNEVLSLIGGRIADLHIRENMPVKRGDLLATIRTEPVDLEIKGILERKSQVTDFIGDLKMLIFPEITSGNTVAGNFATKIYQARYFEYQSTLANHHAVIQKEGRDYDRASFLFETKTIAFSEFDAAKIKYRQAKDNLELYQKRKIAEWEHELAENQKELVSLNNQMNLLNERLDQFKIIAGVSGTLMNIPHLTPGDFIYPNQKLGEISPDTTLIAIANLSPADIGLVKYGQKVVFQVDAYNYNQWGLAEGTVAEISDDLIMFSESEVAFRVICKLDKDKLRLKSGIEGNIKKGMTFNGRFVIDRRSLFQLLYDKVDDWLNPSVQ